MEKFLLIAIVSFGPLVCQNVMAADAATCEALDAKLEEAWNHADQLCERNAKSKECVSAQMAVDAAEDAFVKAGCDEEGGGGSDDDGADDGGSEDEGSDDGAADDGEN